MAFGALAGAAFTPGLLIARMHGLGAGAGVLMLAAALPGLVGLVTARGWQSLKPKRLVCVSICVARLLLVGGFLVAPLLPSGALVLLACVLTANLISSGLASNAVLAWFGRILPAAERVALQSRRNALGSLIGFPAALAAAWLIESHGEVGWWWALAAASACGALDVLLLTRLPAGAPPPVAPTTGNSARSALLPSWRPTGSGVTAAYHRIWWALTSGRALIGMGTLPAVALAGGGAGLLVAIGAGATAGVAAGLWLAGQAASRTHAPRWWSAWAVDPVASDAPARQALASVASSTLLVTVLLLLVWHPGWLVSLAPLMVVVAALDGAVAGRGQALDLGLMYHLSGGQEERLGRLAGVARLNSGLVALGGVALAIGGAGAGAWLPAGVLLVGLLVILAGWRQLAEPAGVRHPVHV